MSEAGQHGQSSAFLLGAPSAQAGPLLPFHLAIPVRDLEETLRFYLDTFACPLGRTADRWADLNFFGHQLSLHLVDEDVPAARHNSVDGKEVPARHFGVVLPWDAWRALADRLVRAATPFVIEPCVRFAGLPGEQGTLFLQDPSGNVLEFKGFRDQAQLFKTG